MSGPDAAYEAPPFDLDPKMYSLSDGEKSFFQQQIGIYEEQALKAHILAVQQRAYKILQYPCIRNLYFLQMAGLPAYASALNLLKTTEKPLLADLGCCFGSDLRKIVADGWPVDSIIASDLKEEFWYLGHELYKSTPQTFPVHFIPGDIFDPSTLSKGGAVVSDTEIELAISAPLPDLKTLKSLTPLQGKLSVIHASMFFHLFHEEKQLELAHLMASLLLPRPGSVIFGFHNGMPEKGFQQNTFRKWPMFCHSPESWRDMWISVFDGGDGKGASRIRVEANLTEMRIHDHYDEAKIIGGERLWFMMWSVTRI